MRYFFIAIFISISASGQNYYPLASKSEQSSDEISSYTLSEKSRTSAGVYTEDGTLLRTLWSNVEKDAGTYKTPEWDGKDDDGKDVLGKAKYINVTSNNVKYEWLSPIGNNSKENFGESVFNNAETIQSMAQVGDFIYYSYGYNEKKPSFGKIKIDDIHTNIRLFKGENYHFGPSCYFLTADDSTVYLGMLNTYNDETLIFGINTNNDTEKIFEYGSRYGLLSGRPKDDYDSVFGLTHGSNNDITGMAVQKHGNYLFVARGKTGIIYVYDKISGKEIKKIYDFSNPKEITFSKDNILWIINDNSITKHTVNSDGTLSTSLLEISVKNPLALSVSNDGSKIAVSSGDTNQVNIYSNDGVLIEKLGRSESYDDSPEVHNDKFMLKNPAVARMGTFLYYQDDGKLWVGDTGNFRSLRFNSDGTLDDYIMYLTWLRSMGVDRKNINRVFGNYLEFKTNIATGEWKFVKNWSGNFKKQYDNEFNRLKFVQTYKNGRTYAFQVKDANNWEVVELTEKGLRYTGVIMPKRNPDGWLMENGDFRIVKSVTDIKASSVPYEWKDRELTGFDIKNNPIWGRESVVAELNTLTSDMPFYRSTSTSFPARNDTEDSLVVSFENGPVKPQNRRSTRYHLGATKIGSTGFEWETAKETGTNYNGDYPKDGRFDNGNQTNYPGGISLVKDKSIFWGHHGEFWKGGQTNKIQHVYSNGLLLGIFGTTSEELTDKVRNRKYPAAPKMAGNNLKADIVKIGQDYYILHGDEGWHGAIHRWKVSNLKSIKEHILQIK